MAIRMLSRLLAGAFAFTTLTAQAPSPTAVAIATETSCAQPNVPPRTIQAAAPVLPPSIDDKRPKGDVEVVVSLDEGSNVTSVRARSGPEALRTVAEETARKSTFATEIIACQPVAKSFVFVVRYEDTPACENRDLAGTTVKPFPPDVPRYVRDNGITGTVRIAVDLDENGHVVKAQALDGPQPLRTPAVDSVYKTLFSPRIVNCVPTAGRYLYVVSFEKR